MNVLLIFMILSSFPSLSNQLYNISNEFRYNIEAKDNTTLLFTFIATKPGWVGLGLGGKTMTKTDMIIVEFIDSKTYYLYDTYSFGHGPPKNDTELGGTFDLKNIKYSYTNNTYQITFERDFDTKDKFDYQFKNSDSIEKIDFSVAWGVNSRIKYHSKFQSVGTIYLKSGKISFVAIPLDDSKPFDFYLLKSIVLTTLWLGFNFSSFIVIRYYKHLSTSIFFHRIVSGLSAIITLIFGLISLVKQWSSKTVGVSASIHLYSGIILMIILIFQISIGINNYEFIKRLQLKHWWIITSKKVHKWIGIFLVWAILISIITGWVNFQKTSILPFILLLVTVYLIILVMFEVGVYFREKQKTGKLVKVEQSLINKYRVLSKSEISNLKKERKIGFYENYVLDVTEFLEYHPGGPVQIALNLNSDFSRFLVGNSSNSDKFTPHDHSFLTMRHILSSMVIGIYEDDSNLVLNYKEGPSVYLNNNFNLSFTRVVAKNVLELKFKSKNQENLIFSRFKPGFNWIGKHYSVTSHKLNKTRYYSSCLCLNEISMSYHRELLKNMKLLEFGKNEVAINLNEFNMFSEHLELFVKKYEYENALSKHLHEFSKKEDILIKGPIGQGLNIKTEYLTGSYLCFSNGTGAFCFLDLVALTLRYMRFLIKQKTKKQDGTNLLIEEDFSYIKNDFKLVYYSSFRDVESSVYDDICQEMYEISERMNLNVFRYVSRFSNENSKKWDDEFVTSQINAEKNISMVFLCGTTEFMQTIKNSIDKSNLIENYKVQLV